MKHLYLDILVFIFLFFIVSLGVLFYVPDQKSNQKPHILTVNNSGGVSLFFSPNPIMLSSDTPGTVDLMIDTNGKPVTNVQAELTFDPASITNIIMSKPDQPFFPEETSDITLSDIRYTNGRISYAVSLKPGVEARTGRGKIAKVSFVRAPYNPTSFTQISFIDQSSVLSDASNESVLTSARPLIVQFITPVGSGSGILNPLPGQ